VLFVSKSHLPACFQRLQELRLVECPRAASSTVAIAPGAVSSERSVLPLLLSLAAHQELIAHQGIAVDLQELMVDLAREEAG
jgi:hypothetical protein